MSKIAIKYSDLLALADKHRIGKTDFVSLDTFFDDARAKAFKFPGVRRCNDWDIEADGCSKLKAAQAKVNQQNRYCKTLKELVELLGVSRATLYRWRNSLIGLIDRQYINEKCGFYYDAMDILQRWEKVLNDRRPNK